MIDENVHSIMVRGLKNRKSATIIRPANTTQYTAKDVINQATLAVSGATNASPIVITTSAAHGLTDGDAVTIASVGGNTNANGTFWVKVTGYSTTTFALYTNRGLDIPRAGNAAYTSGGTVQPIPRLRNLLSKKGGKGYVVKARLNTNLKTFLDQIQVHLYNAPVSAIADNSPFLLLDANWISADGTIDFTALATEDSTNSDSSYAILTPGVGNLPLEIEAAEDNQDFYPVLKTNGTGTPASGQTFKLQLAVEED